MALKPLLRVVLWLSFLLAWAPGAVAQKSSPPNTPRSDSNVDPPIPGQILVVSGKVMIAEGLPITERIAIERVCHGTVKREGYTDLKGHFSIQLGQNNELSDASEHSDNDLQTTSTGLPIVGAVPMSNTMSRNIDAAHRQLAGCQLRAAMPGFQSSSVLIVADGNAWKLEVGTITLKRIENMEGSAISLTTLSAPQEAQRAYHKGEKDLMDGKIESAEKNLNKAVELYRPFAAAWVLLGEIHRQQNKLALASENYNQAIAADPAFVNPYFGLAVLAFNEKNWAETEKFTGEVIRLNAAAFPLAHLYNAYANFYLGRLDAAQESVQKFQGFDTEQRQPASYLLLSEVLGSKRDFAGAIVALQTYLRLAPSGGNADAARELLKRYQEAAQQAAVGKQP